MADGFLCSAQSNAEIDNKFRHWPCEKKELNFVLFGILSRRRENRKGVCSTQRVDKHGFDHKLKKKLRRLAASPFYICEDLLC